MFDLHPCIKRYTRDLDKAVPPEETVNRIKSLVAQSGQLLLESTQRVDTGRLGIPVYMSVCGPRAREVMPTRKQMGKGASAAQAEASALMEFIERYSLFSFLTRKKAESSLLTWSQAQRTFKHSLIPIKDLLLSVHEERPEQEAVQILDCVPWSFCPAFDLHTADSTILPLDWFQTLNEFNGSSAGNTEVESVLQGLCELVERHVCARIDLQQPVLPNIDPDSITDPVLHELLSAFVRNNIFVLLKDFSLEYGVPTVGALAYDPANFPKSSEIVFTAGTATSPEKAAIRALTEVAQLAGDFETESRYEASGLSKFTRIEQCEWLWQGNTVSLSTLPDISDPDMQIELSRLLHVLAGHGHPAYAVRTTDPGLQIPAHYSIVPGFDFRERSSHPSLGLFVGRILAEQQPENVARHGLQILEHFYPHAHFLPFFQGILAMRTGRYDQARAAFAQAEPLQPTDQDTAFAVFYQAYCLSQEEKWGQATPLLDRAVDLAPDVHAFYNLRGVSHFKGQRYDRAVQDFHSALNLNPGSAMDLVNLGLSYKRMGQHQKAIVHLQAGLELDPDLERARAELEDLLV